MCMHHITLYLTRIEALHGQRTAQFQNLGYIAENEICLSYGNPKRYEALS